jgi:hypothetical protein
MSPTKGERMVRYYGYYSNFSGGNGRRKTGLRSFPTFSNHLKV